MPTIDKSLVMNNTSLRIKDPKVSIPFYTENFGMKLIRTINLGAVSLYMLNYETKENKSLNWAAREGVLELTHTHGTETDANFKVSNGNGSDAKGFGHICVSVDNIVKSEELLLSKGVKFQKTLSQGSMRNIAFALDPDGYWIELVEHGVNQKPDSTDMSTYKFNHSMIRVKDAKKSLDFYRNILGFKLIASHPVEAGKFTLYFLAYVHDDNFVENSVPTTERHQFESLVELTHNWGTEDDADFAYHNGNSTENGATPGFSHICISCKDSVNFCKTLEQTHPDLSWSTKIGTSQLSPELAFLNDPDGYTIEILPSDALKEGLRSSI